MYKAATEMIKCIKGKKIKNELNSRQWRKAELKQDT